MKDGSNGAGGRSADLAPPWLEWGLLAVALALFVWRGFLPAWRHLLTDFPNYYLAGRLFREGVPLDRLYDWEWLQRQKDHLGLDQSLVGFVPLTMFSALLAAPLTSLSALAAKHVWLVFNLLLLPAIAWLLRAITGQPFRRVALIGLLAVVPLRTNFQFGQQHLFVLFLLTVATWCYFRGHDVSAGAVLAVAAAVKLYPAGFVLLLVRKRRWRALASMAVAGLLIAAVGIALFGVEPWSVFAQEIVPRAVLRAEVTDPYDTHMSSLAGMLRRLLIFEPELNPHPLAHAPAAFAVLQPLFAAGILATGLWLLTPGRASAERERLDWAATLGFVLLLSTGTPTYHLCALILAAVLAVDCLLRMQWVTWARALLLAFTILCLVTQDLIPEEPAGWHILTAYPRVYALAVAWLVMAAAQRRLGGPGAMDRRRAARFAVVFGAIVIASSWSWMRHFDGQFAHYARLLPRGAAAWPAHHPVAVAGTAADGPAVIFVRMDPRGYVLDRTPTLLRTIQPAGTDLFHPTVAPGRSEGWAELAAARGSRVVRFSPNAAELSVAVLPTEIEDAEAPVVSSDGSRLGFIRTHRGRGQLWLLERATGAQRPITSADWDVLDFGFFPDNRVVFVARRSAAPPGLYVAGADMTRSSAPLVASDGPVRNPAVSPDGRWLAYTEREYGNWQLRLASLDGGERRRLTSADCNHLSPAWRSDSRSLVYATDCARGVGLTTLAELQAVP
jgi:hypothetical protein